MTSSIEPRPDPRWSDPLVCRCNRCNALSIRMQPAAVVRTLVAPHGRLCETCDARFVRWCLPRSA